MAEKAPKKRQNSGNLLIMMFSLFQHWIPVKWPAKAQEYEFGAIRSMGKRRTASSSRRQKSAKKRQNRGNLLIMMFSRFHPSIPVECLQKPKKPSLVQFGQWVSPGQRRRLDGQKSAKKAPKPLKSANNDIIPFPTLDSGGMACKSPRNRVWCNSVKG